MSEQEKKTFLGLDLSTQKLKAVVTDANLKVIHEAEVQFDSELPEFRTSGGVCRHESGEVLAPTIMWVKALDLLLDKLVLSGTDFSEVVALSGAAQQHGSVWWARGASDKLANLRHEEFLHHQLAGCFTCDSPVWLDSTTTEECKALEQAVGGPNELAKITGSRAYERFTGAQIRKVYTKKQRVYQSTERIALVSSFAASLFIGEFAPIDHSDGSGMNLLDINTKKWHSDLLKFCGGEELVDKLGKTVPSYTVVGNVTSYFVKRFGFRADCKVIAFTGDNPSALAGLRLKANWVGLSLGTSDTLLVGLSSPRAPPAGHILLGPTRDCPYMALLCFSNGSLTREEIRDEIAQGSWETFDQLLDDTLRGNLGNMGIFYTTAEIVPRAAPCRRMWNSSDVVVHKLQPALVARALLEGQALARRHHATDVGVHLDSNSRIVATGGASANKNLLQIFADVFNCPVYVQEEHSNAAVIGSVVRASEVWSEIAQSNQKVNDSSLAPVATPFKNSQEIYEPMLARYEKLVQTMPKLQDV